MDTEDLRTLQSLIERLRDHSDDAVILSVGTCARDQDVDDGFAEATVRMGDKTATARGKYLDVAIRLARRKILDEREAKEKARSKEAKRSTAEPSAIADEYLSAEVGHVG